MKGQIEYIVNYLLINLEYNLKIRSIGSTVRIDIYRHIAAICTRIFALFIIILLVNRIVYYIAAPLVLFFLTQTKPK